MEAVNGVSDGGPPPPSPLTGCYLLIVIGEPHSQEHKDIILRRVAKGLLSWDLSDCMVDLEKELAIITDQAPDGEEARYGERLIQYASENLVTEILIHPAVSTLSQCVRNLLSSFTRHRHIIHSGYTFAANGSWALQDGTFSLADFSEAFQELDVQRVIRAYDNGISVDIHCSPEGDWPRLPKESFAKNCKVRLNPVDVLPSSSPAIADFLNYITPFLVPLDIITALESSEVVGNIRFSHPTLYVFPGGQGDAALFGINGFNMLLDGGFSRKACFWDFVRHLDRLDAVLLTRLNNSNVSGIMSVLKRKRQNAVYPQIGHFFCNIQERKALLSPDGDKDRDPLLINLMDEGQDIVTNLKHLNLQPQSCYRDSEPINLYHKVGHGTLDMYVLSPAKDSREVREFIQKWNSNDNRLFSNPKTKEFSFPLPNIVSICALLVWQPSNSSENITRILFPGSSPQNKIFEGLDRLKQLDCIKYPVCSEISLNPPKKTKEQIFDSSKPQKILPEVKKEKSPRLNDMKPKEHKDPSKQPDNKITDTPEIKKEIKKSDSTDSDKSAAKLNNKTDTKPAKDVKETTATSKAPRARDKDSKSVERKPAVKVEKKPSPTTPKKTITNGDVAKPKAKVSPTATPAKSAKEASNRKVLESKKQVSKEKKEPKPAEKKVEAEKKAERKPISRRPKPPAAPAVKAVTGSPIRKKPESIAKKAKLDKDGTTDSSTVSTPTADELKRDISKLTPEEIEQLKAQELADLQEEQEVVQEIEAVFRKGEEREASESEMRKIKNISIEEKTDEEYLLIEKVEIQEDETQKLMRDSEESEKQRKLSEPKVEAPKEIISPEEKNDKVESGTLPDEKISATVESGATTAPTLPEDERIPLDEIKEKDDTQVIEEKHVREETKEKESIPTIQLPSKSIDATPPVKPPPVVGIRLDKQQHIRDIVKTPDEVADLPVHEVADHYADYQKNTDEQATTLVKEVLQNVKTAVQNGVDDVKDEVKAVVDEIIEQSKDIVDKTNESEKDVPAVDAAERKSDDIKVFDESTKAVEKPISELQKTAVDISDVIKDEVVETKDVVLDEIEEVVQEELKAVQIETKEVEEKVEEETKIIDSPKQTTTEVLPTTEINELPTIEKTIGINENKAHSKVKDEINERKESEDTKLDHDEVKQALEVLNQVADSKESTIEAKEIAEITETEKIIDGVQNIVEEKIEEGKTTLETIEDKIIDDIKEIKETLTNNATDIRDSAEKDITEIKSSGEEIIKDVKLTKDEVKSTISEHVDDKITDVQKTVEDTISSTITTVDEISEQLKSAVQEEVTTIKDAITESAQSTKDTLEDSLIKTTNEIEQKGAELASDVKSEINKTADEITNAKESIQQDAAEIVDKVKEVVKEERDSISGFFSKGLSKLEETTKSLGDKITEGVSKVLGDKEVDEKDNGEKKEKEEESTTPKTMEMSIVVQTVDMEVPEIINIQGTPESPCTTPFDFIDKVDLGRKSPKEREEDVAKIVASVAEVLKSEAPLEDFKGKIPLEITTFPTFTPYTTELRETHITTVDSPISDLPGQITPIKEEKIDEVLKEMEDDIDANSNNSKISSLIKSSNELLEASSKIITSIKEQKEEESTEEDKENEENVDTGTVHRMLVTASSEDGGEETVICPPGSITYPKSSESSGKSSPDLRKEDSQKPEISSPESSQDAPSVLQKEPEISAKMKSEDIPETKDKVDTDDKKPDLEDDFEDNKATEARLAKESDSRKSSVQDDYIKSGKSTPDVAKSGKMTPDVDKSGKATPDIAKSGKATPDIAKSRPISPDVAKSGKTTPDISKSGKATPDIAKTGETSSDIAKSDGISDISKSGKTTPDVATSGKSSPDVVQSGKTTPDIPKSGTTSPDIVKSGKISPVVDKSGKTTPDVTKSDKASEVDKLEEATLGKTLSGKVTPEVAKSGQATPDITKSGKTTPSIPKSGNITPDIAASGKTTPDVPKSGKATPDIPISGKATPDIAKSGKITPDISHPSKTSPEILDITKSGKTTPDCDKSGKTTPSIPKSGSITPDIATSGKTTPDVPKSGKATPDIPISGKATPDIAKSGKTTPDILQPSKTSPEIPISEIDSKIPDTEIAKLQKITPEVEKKSSDISKTGSIASDISKSGKTSPDIELNNEKQSILKLDLITPDVSKSSSSTPDIPKSGKDTPIDQNAEKVIPEIAASGKSTPEVSKSDIKKAETPVIDSETSEMPASGKLSSASIKSGTSTPDIPKSGKITPETPKSGKETPEIPKSGKETPEIPKSGKQTPDIPKSGKSTPGIPDVLNQMSSQIEESTPDKPQSGKSTPDVLKSGKSTPDIPISGRCTPDVGKVTSVIDKSDRTEKNAHDKLEKLSEISHLEINDCGDKVINGQISPDFATSTTVVEDKKCVLSSSTTTTESKIETHIDSKELLPENIESSNMTCCARIENEKAADLSINLVDGIESGKSTPEINNISGKSSPDLPKSLVLDKRESVQIEKSPVISGKGTPEISKSGISSPDLGKTDSIRLDTDSLASGKGTPDVNVEHQISVARHSVQLDTDSLASGKMTPEFKHDLSSGKVTPDLDKHSAHIETDSLASGKLAPDIHKMDVSSGKSTPDIPATGKSTISSGKSTPDSHKTGDKPNLDTKDDVLHIGEDLKSGKSTPDTKESEKLILSGKSTPDKLEQVLSSKKNSTNIEDSASLKHVPDPDIKPSESEDSHQSKEHLEQQLSGKSTPVTDDAKVETSRKDSLQLTSSIPSGKSTPDDALKLDGQSSPDDKDRKATPEPHVQDKRDSINVDKVQTGKSTPDVTETNKNVLHTDDKAGVASGKSTPDLGKLETMTIDQVHSGKTTPDVHKDDKDTTQKSDGNLQFSGKSTPEPLQCNLPSGKSTPISPDHQNGLSRDSIPSGKSTPGLSGKVTPEPDISSGKCTPEPVFTTKTDFKTDAKDIKEEAKLSSGKSTPDSGFIVSSYVSTTTNTTLSSSKVTTAECLKQEIKTHVLSGTPSPDFTKRSSIQAEHILSGKSTPDSIKLSHHDDSGKSTPDFGKRGSIQAEHILSGKSTPDLPIVHDLAKRDSLPISGQSTPLRGKTSPDVLLSDDQGKTTAKVSDVSSTFDVTQLQSAHVFRELMEETIVSSVDVKKETNGDVMYEKHESSKLEMAKETISGKSTPDFTKGSRKSSFMSGADDSDYRKFSITSENTKTSSMISGKSTPERKEDTHSVQAFINAERQSERTPSPSTDRKPSQSDVMTASGFHADPMSTSFYGALPEDSDDEDIVHPRNETDLMTSSFIGDLPTDDKTDEQVKSWGKPLGLPSPAPLNDNKGTPKKEKKLPANVSVKNRLNQRSESPSKKKKINPIYVDLTYVPHHGNSYYSQVDFFKRVRARYYVFSGIEPSKDVYNALLEAKQTWEDKDLEVTIIPTYDTDVLGYWVAENEELLTKYKIDLSPSASRCTINLQDHETSCSAYRLEF